MSVVYPTGVHSFCSNLRLSGKTRRAVALAREFGGEIISADSRQLYRGMDLGIGKDLEEYGDVPYHMIDICPAGYRYNLYEYVRDFGNVYADYTLARTVAYIVWRHRLVCRDCAERHFASGSSGESGIASVARKERLLKN